MNLSFGTNITGYWNTVRPEIQNDGITEYETFSYNNIALQEAILQCVTGP